MGGPLLDIDKYTTMYYLAALEHNIDVVKAVPLIYKMVSKKEFATIEDRKDDRIFKTIDGKSTCRVYLHCWCNVTRMLLEWDAAGQLDKWIQRWSETFHMARKSV